VSIRFACPACGRGLDFADQMKGATRPCPHCGVDLLIWPVQQTERDVRPGGRGRGVEVSDSGRLIGPTHIRYDNSGGTRGRWLLWAAGVVGVAGAALVVALAALERGAELPGDVTEHLQREAAARMAGLEPEERLDQLLNEDSVPVGLRVAVAGVLDKRLVVVEGAGGSVQGRRGGRYVVYALLISRNDPAVALYEQFEGAVTGMRALLADEEAEVSAFGLAEGWDELRRLQRKTVGGRALVVRLDPLLHPTLYREAVRFEQMWSLGTVALHGADEMLPAVDASLLWKGSRQMDRCRRALERVMSGTGGLERVELTIERMGFRRQVAAAFVAMEMADNLDVVGMFAEKQAAADR